MKKLRILLPILALLLGCVLLYTRPMTLSRLCDGVELSRVQSITVSYEIYPDNEFVQFDIDREDPRFALLMEQLAAQPFRRSVLNIFPPTAKTHSLHDGDYKWELSLQFSDVTLRSGETVSGALIHISDFYGKPEIRFVGKTVKCSAAGESVRRAAITEIIQ